MLRNRRAVALLDDKPAVIVAASANWWLSGGISAANCLAAHAAKGASSFTVSKSNLANPGTYELSNGSAYPSWNVATGWTFVSASSQSLIIATGYVLKPCTVIVRLVRSTSSTNRCILGSIPDKPTLDYRVSSSHKGNLVKQNTANIGSSTSVIANSSAVIAVSYSSSGEYQHYLNGSTDGSGTNNQTITDPTNRIGAPDYFDGDIYFLSVYNTVLTNTQVLAVSQDMAAL
jgi:hypothetical protein